MAQTKIKKNTVDLFYELTRTDFVMRYQNSVLGFAWVLLRPFLLFLILVFVFSWFFNSHDPNYRYNLLLGVIIFSYFSEATNRGIVSLKEKSAIILKVNFPKTLAIYTSVVNSFISFFFSFLVFLLFWLLTKPVTTSINLPYFLIQIFSLSCLIAGLNFFIGIIYINLRDLSSIWELLLRLLFYGTPIIYPLSSIPAQYKKIFLLNPLAVIISESRKALINGEMFSWGQTIYALLLALMILLFGFHFFRKNIKFIAEKL